MGPDVFCGDDPRATKDQELPFFTLFFLKADTKLHSDTLAESGEVSLFSAGMESFNIPSLSGFICCGLHDSWQHCLLFRLHPQILYRCTDKTGC